MNTLQSIYFDQTVGELPQYPELHGKSDVIFDYVDNHVTDVVLSNYYLYDNEKEDDIKGKYVYSLFLPPALMVSGKQSFSRRGVSDETLFDTEDGTRVPYKVTRVGRMGLDFERFEIALQDPLRVQEFSQPVRVGGKTVKEVIDEHTVVKNGKKMNAMTKNKIREYAIRLVHDFVKKTPEQIKEMENEFSLSKFIEDTYKTKFKPR
jgi:hypothetical protein